jgi:predicted O-methyltransferase YrrM
MIIGDSKIVLGAWKDVQVNIAFIDGSHDCEDVIIDFENVLKILQPGGLVIFDNTTMGGVYDALRHIKLVHSGNFIEFPFVSWSPPGFVFWKA